MAATVRNLLYLGTDGLHRGAKASEEDALQLYNIEATNNLKSKALQVTDFTTADGVLQSDGSGFVSSAKILNKNVASNAAIEDTKLGTISTAGKVADTALSSKVLFTDQNRTVTADYTFSGAVNVPAPTQSTHAVTKAYADALANGLDPKQEVRAVLTFSTYASDITSANLSSWVSSGWIAVGNRVLLIKLDENREPTSATQNGIYTVTESSGTYGVSRTADMANGSDAAGASVFAPTAVMYNSQTSQWMQDANFKSLLTCTNISGSAVVNSDALSFVIFYSGVTSVYGSAPIGVSGSQVSLNYSAGLTVQDNNLKVYIDADKGLEFSGNQLVVKADSGISLSNSGVKAKVDDSTIQLDNSGNIAFKSLPSQFKINGTATSTDVTAANLGTLTAGTTSDASDKHYHVASRFSRARSTNAAGAFSLGTIVGADPSDSNKLIEADKSATNTAKPFGVVVTDNSGTPVISTSGVVEITGDVNGASVGEVVYLGDDGAFCKYGSIGSGDVIVKMGRYIGNNRVALQIQDYGIKP